MATSDIFKLFKASIEQVKVKKTTYGTLSETTVYENTLDAIVKRRNGSSEGTSDDKLFTTATTVHFRATDIDKVELNNFVLVDGKWRQIVNIKDGRDFHKGVSEFILVALGDEIKDNPTSPDWGE